VNRGAGWSGVARAGGVAAVLSGVPSTVYALATRRPFTEAARAAGALIGRTELAAGVVVHAGISTFWTLVIVQLLPAHRSWLTRAGVGAAYGAAIAAFDLGVVGRRVPAIRALPRWPQVLDHVAFGALVGGLAPVA
jgi:hypothetical protein